VWWSLESTNWTADIWTGGLVNWWTGGLVDWWIGEVMLRVEWCGVSKPKP
jgi:hypothetical protein